MHWGMSVACYPFFAEVAAQVGKLLALNGHANLSQIVRRMTETSGDRSTLPRAVQRVGMGLTQASSHSASFPFDVRLNASSARKSDQLRVLRQGDQTDFVELAAR
jgi:hypothetical protein